MKQITSGFSKTMAIIFNTMVRTLPCISLRDIHIQIDMDKDLFIDIPGATTATYQPAELTRSTFYRVMVTESIGGEATCQAISSCIRVDVASMIGGCIVEDTNRDGLLNDGNTPIAGIPIYIYLSTDLTTPIDSILTD